MAKLVLRACFNFAVEEEALAYANKYTPAAKVSQETGLPTKFFSVEIPEGQPKIGLDDDKPAYPAFFDDDRTIALCRSILAAGEVAIEDLFEPAATLLSSIERRQAADRVRQNAELAGDPYGIYLRHYTMAATGSPVYGHQEETTRDLAAQAMGARDGLKEKAREKINPSLPLDRLSFEDDLADMLVEKAFGRPPAT